MLARRRAGENTVALYFRLPIFDFRLGPAARKSKIRNAVPRLSLGAASSAPTKRRQAVALGSVRIKRASQAGCWRIGRRGGMGEWLKPAVLKTVIPFTRDRGFESLSLRHNCTFSEAGFGR
jgi:hypothetical protein